MLDSSFAHIFSQDEDPADSVPVDDLEGTNLGCMIQWVKSRFVDDLPRWVSFSPVYYIDSVDH